ncbi:sensor histidine kinase [bacterium]|nr:sensor histidine kinase [bacterium]NBX97920.1 sensor histidine kinase [bacterium]NDC94312.1 sensor histidine kinase [bacterium]NDD82788.1 sensor histidine kinase [bacterium]NDG28836.1 sensor histidine kinase [bacterium]
MGLFSAKSKPKKTSALASSLQSEKIKSDIILSAIDDCVVYIDTSGVIYLFNPAASKLTGWLSGEAIGVDYRSVITLIDEKGVPIANDLHPFTVVLMQKTPIRSDNAIIKNRNGASISIDMTVSPLFDANEQLQGAVSVIRDVTEQRRAEKQRAEFISTASHEMRTPVAAIEGYLALALNDKVSKIDDKARSFLTKAHESTQHLGKLFQDLLTSAKAEDGRLTSHPIAVEMSEFVEKLTQDLKFVAEKKNLQLECTIGSPSGFTDASKVIKPLYYVQADPDRLREVITNLFDNAVKYTETGKITISLSGDDKVVQFRIRDTGPGIPIEDQPHLFQKFYRVDNSATRTIGGTGLGLFITKKIIELYSGRIWVESTPGLGSTFIINLPRITSERARQLQKEEDSRPAGSVYTQNTAPSNTGVIQ